MLTQEKLLDTYLESQQFDEINRIGSLMLIHETEE